jgi:hypothetical protein
MNHYLEATLVIDWKHDAVELGGAVQMMDIHHTVRSFFIICLLHAVEDEFSVRRESCKERR